MALPLHPHCDSPQGKHPTTLTALLKLYMMRDSRVESLLVVGYNPSHKNIKSEVNAPFKMLSTLLRFLASENKDKDKVQIISCLLICTLFFLWFV